MHSKERTGTVNIRHAWGGGGDRDKQSLVRCKGPLIPMCLLHVVCFWPTIGRFGVLFFKLKLIFYFTHSHETNIKDEMQALKSLRAQLEEGIRLNDSLRAQLHEKLASSKTTSPHPASPYDAAYQREIQELKLRLEDSERWNASLQARLNELQPRVSGVGGSSGRDSGDGGPGSPSKVHRLEQVIL